MLLEIVRQALDTIGRHRRWAALTMFGIVWGTASVILLVGWGIGVRHMTEAGMQKVGKNLMWILPGRVGEDLSPADERRALEFEVEDVAALRAEARHAELVSAQLEFWASARRARLSRNVHVRGVEPSMLALRDVRLTGGRFITADDVRLQRRVVVLGATTRERLFGTRPAVGAHLELNGQRYEVIAVLGRVGPQLSRDGPLIDEQAWIPITTALTVTGRDTITAIILRPPQRALNEDLKAEVRRILGRRLHVSPADEEAVFIISMMDYLSTFDSVFAVLNVFLVVLAVGTLVIGGIGVMNMMLVAVSERRREIGLRLAVGGTRRDIVAQFLIETLVICGVGGAAGLALGLGGCLLLGPLPKEVFPVPVVVPGVVALAVVVTTLVGVASGAGPAWQAARVDPAESLRSE